VGVGGSAKDELGSRWRDKTLRQFIDNMQGRQGFASGGFRAYVACRIEGRIGAMRLTEEKGDHERNEVDVNRLKIRLIINQLNYIRWRRFFLTTA
jgi:hypothetical protein